MALTPETRERIRRNVGYPHVPRRLHPPTTPITRELFFPTRVEPIPGAPPAPPPEPSVFAFPGHSYALTGQLPAGTREIFVTPKIGFPFQLRQITITGGWAATDAVSLRVLVSDDNDTTAVVDPTGQDVVISRGDAVGAEDPGMRLAPINGPILLEPWTIVRPGSRYLKVKAHNAALGAINIGVFFDLDELPA